MELNEAVGALSAIAQETRLTIFRLLMHAGPEGMAAGAISDALSIAPPTISFHLKELRTAGLIDARRTGRSLIYTAEFATMRELLAFMTNDCCNGHPEICGVGAVAAKCE